MNDPGKNEQIEDRAKKLFDNSVERLDAATLSRLNQGRHKALDELRRAENTISWGRWLPAAGVAAVAVAPAHPSARHSRLQRGPRVALPIDPGAWDRQTTISTNTA